MAVKSFLVCRGQKPTLLEALKKLNEISVITVALYVLLSFQGIPVNCPISQYQSCYHNLYTLTQSTGESGNFFSMGVSVCGPARQRCFDTLVVRYSNKWLPLLPELVALNPAYYQFCYCIMKIATFDEVETLTHPATASNISMRVQFTNLTQASVDVALEPSRTCDNSLLVVSLVVFFTALFMVVIGEILVPRLVSIIVLLTCAAAFYAGTLGTLYAAANACPGAQVSFCRHVVVVQFLKQCSIWKRWTLCAI
jgi:hypothetical protein